MPARVEMKDQCHLEWKLFHRCEGKERTRGSCQSKQENKGPTLFTPSLAPSSPVYLVV